FPVPVGDFVNAALRIELIREELLFMAKLFSKKRIDECDVVVHAPRLEDFFAAESESQVPFALRNVIVALFVILAELAPVPPVFNVLPQLEAQAVRIDLTGMSGNCS